jgi:uncharacterized protein YoxC|tara:strand:- start:234 stop:635 length:402 start_codon:yes stop_codon:yes gene_type:complete
MQVKTSQTASTVSTIANVITAFCLMVLTISLVVGGVWTANTVTTLQHTYHPDKISSMINDISDTVHTLHATTHMLKSGKGQLDILTDIHNLVNGIEDLSVALNKLPLVVQESSNWRNMSVYALGHFKDMIAAL